MPTALEDPDTLVTLADEERVKFSRDVIARADAAYTASHEAILERARFRHRGLRGHDLDDAMGETEAFAWYSFLKLTQAGGEPDKLLSPIVDFAAGRFYDDRRFAGKVHAHDAMSEERRRSGHFVPALPSSDDDEVASEVRDGLRSRTPSPAEEARFHADWQAFLATLTPKEQELTRGLEAGWSVAELSRQRGVSKTAGQDMRKTIARKWDEFSER